MTLREGSVRRGQHRGFTLVELVIVVVLLGILAAFAIPRFANTSTSARVAVINGLRGAMQSAATNFRAQCGVTPTCNPNVDYGTSYVTGPDGLRYLSGYGYPMAWDAKHSPGYNGIAGYIDYSGFTQTPYASLGCCDIAYFTLDSAPDPSNCYVRYYGGRIRTPQITTATSGC